jgi:kinesin family protein C2/C3
MEGPKDNPGLYSRTLKRLFEESGKMTDTEYKMSTSLLEIYNDKLIDLIEPTDSTLKIVQGTYGNEVPDLKKIDVDSEQAVLEVLARGAKNRSTAATKMNERSSRSHLVLSMYVKAKNNITNVEFMGKLHLIDLAGSERVKQSGVTGDRLKEAQAINVSLSALGNCISARANKTQHVPYRDSTLTYLLQDSLEKNSKTLMFVQISPTATNAAESVCSLKFAERVRKVELGKAEKTVVRPPK